MPRSSTGPADADTYVAVCDRTHLFPGARCRVQGLPDPRGFAARPAPIDVDVRFSDGVIADARLSADDPAAPVLIVAAYTTAAGTSIDGRGWVVRGTVLAGDEVELILGGAAPV
ncbi:hypothetical protein DMH12_04700 [Streptomyces sp. WAC 04229]|uniref:hypothetical protein n=1 Tax=Streptomyces sp. WAC 04229 TaxID=2203206 RepID=UPI000F7412AE|nr:hypothetical protein [Streptomyces sp. WAC 04229]RSN63814.1 hypothetical protein DMH12_04700 [Streptomyces sp. WAC 04229]